jgi:hypothetical protein
VKITLLPKATYMFNAILIKIPMTIITEIEKISPKVHLETQKTVHTQGNTEKKEQCWRYHNILQRHSKTKNRYEDWWNSIEDLDMNPCSYAHLTFDKGTKNIRRRKDSNKWCWENSISAYRKLNKMHIFHPV